MERREAPTVQTSPPSAPMWPLMTCSTMWMLASWLAAAVTLKNISSSSGKVFSGPLFFVFPLSVNLSVLDLLLCCFFLKVPSDIL